jgi:hypothetical protein
VKEILLANAVTATTTVNSGTMILEDLRDYAIHVNFSGSNLVGTLKLQAIGTTAEFANDDWVDISSSSQAVTGAASHVWNVTGAGYKYVRSSWAYTSGAGTITVTATIKELVVKGF